MRPVQIEKGLLKYAQGSALISVGNTKVICAGMVEEGVPLFLRGSGKGWMTAEYNMLPYSTPTRAVREPGQKRGRSHEIQRMIGRALRAVVNLNSFSSLTIWFDCDVLQADGGTRCAAITGCFLTLIQVDNWLRDKGMLQGVLIKDSLAAVSVGVVEDQCLLDLSYQEDSMAAVDMNVVMTGSGRLVELQVSGEEASFTRQTLGQLLDLAEGGISHLIQLEKEIAGKKRWNWFWPPETQIKSGK